MLETGSGRRTSALRSDISLVLPHRFSGEITARSGETKAASCA